MSKKDRNLVCYANVQAKGKGEKQVKFGEFGIGFCEGPDASELENFFVKLFREHPEKIHKIKLSIRSVNFIDGSVEKEAATIELDLD